MNRYLASALLLLWACSPNEPVEPEKPDPTPGKTTTDLTLSAAPFCGDWTKGDAVSVLDGNGNHRYTAQGDGRSVKFKGDASLDGKDIVVISPYSSTASIKDNTLLLSVPETQGRFTPLSAGCSTGTTLSMRSVTQYSNLVDIVLNNFLHLSKAQSVKNIWLPYCNMSFPLLCKEII